MNAVLQEILESRTVRASDGHTFPLHSHIPPPECEIIQAWIGAHRPRGLLEVGLGYGVSSLFICDTIRHTPQVDYHIIDAFQRDHWHSIGVNNLERAGYAGLYHLHEERSELCLPRMLGEGMRFDFALIDGWHTFDQALVDFFYVNRMLNVGGVVVFDDIHLPSIQKAAAHVATYDCYQPLAPPEEFRRSAKARARRLLELPEARVVGFLKTADDARNWDWHRDF